MNGVNGKPDKERKHITKDIKWSRKQKREKKGNEKRKNELNGEMKRW